MTLYLPRALAKNLAAAKADQGGGDGQMQWANARAALNLRHVQLGAAQGWNNAGSGS